MVTSSDAPLPPPASPPASAASIGDGWLVESKFRRPTPARYSKAFQASRIMPIELVVFHYTAGGFESSINWLTSHDSSASAHFIVKKNGEVWQLAPVTDRTWHAGGAKSSWRGRGQVNNRSIGIEIENWGKLITRQKDDVVEIMNYREAPFTAPYAVAPDGTFWDAYTEEQLLALERLTWQLVKLFPQLLDEGGISSGPPNGRFVGHQHVDPTRKIDPGPVFPWDRILYAAIAKGT